MDLAEIKERSERDWAELVNYYTLNSERAEACANQQMKDVRDLITEVDRLTASGDKACRGLLSAFGSHETQRKVCERLIAENTQLRSSLTLSREEGRREGMEEAANIADIFVLGENEEGVDVMATDVAAAIRSESKGERK